MLSKKHIIIIVSALLSILAAVAAVILILKYTKSVTENPLSVNSDFTSSVESSLPDTSSEESLPAAAIEEKIGLVLTAPAKTSITTTESFYTFKGSSDPLYPLTLNGNTVERGENGIFSFTANLNVGKNTFSFVHKDKTYTYTVNYRYVVINSYSPSTKQTYSSGSTFSVSVTARKGSTATAAFNGQTITLTPQPSEDDAQFINYTGNFQLPSDNFSDLSLGKITYTATENGKSESFTSGNIICKKPDFIVDYDPNATPLGGKYVNVGSGKIAEIINYQAETFDAKSTNDWSRPTNNYLPKGTVDYAAQQYYYYKDQKQYALLRCGYQVYTSRKDNPGNEYVAVVREYAGQLPDHNEVGIAAFTSEGNHTLLTMDTLWKAPFYFDIMPQQYNNPSRQDYTISNVSFNYIDITFCYSTVFNGELPDLTDNPIFQSAQIIQNQSDYTLRLYLKKQGGFYGWDSYYNANGQLVFEFLNPAKVTAAENSYGTDLTGVKILLDVGHGGKDPGAVSFSNTYTEAERNLFLANKIKAELESIGATVYLTRTGNTTSTTDDKMTMIERLKPDYCLAIHHNSNDYSSPNGFDSYYFSPFAKKAAEYVWMHTSNTTIYRDCGLSWHYYFMARSTNCPVVLTENGFISNSYDYNHIINDASNTEKARAITNGIVEYFRSIQ